jgi:hypothetical protein
MTRQRSRVLVATLALAMGGGALAQSGRQASLMAVHVAVERAAPMTDGSRVVPWTLVGGLGASDFEVVSDGTACRVESLSANTAPLSLVVLVDVSAGTEVTVDSLLMPLQTALVSALKPGDRLAFGRFGGIPLDVDGAFSSRPDELRRAAHAVLTPPSEVAVPPPAASAPAPTSGPVKPELALLAHGLNGGFGLGPSPVWDAVDAAVTSLESEVGRRAIILLTDGRSTGNVLSLDQAIQHANAADASVFVVSEAVDETLRQGTSTPMVQVRPTASLQFMAESTGGACAAVFGPEKWRPKRIDALAARRSWEREGGEPLRPARIDEQAFAAWAGRMLSTFVGELHGGYQLRFVPPAGHGQLHALDVRVRQPEFRVRAPRRYVAPAGVR